MLNFDLNLHPMGVIFSSMNGRYLEADDSELMHLIVGRHQSALMALYARYGDQVYSLALQIINVPGLAEEITQDTFLKIWRQAERWDGSKGKLSSWILTVARYSAIDRYRQETRPPYSKSVPLENIVAVHGQPAVVDDPHWANGQLLRALLDELPAEQAQVIKLGYYHGMSHSEMAQALDLPLGTIKTRVRLGMQKLKDLWHEADRADER